MCIRDSLPTQEVASLRNEIQTWSLYDSVYPDREFNGGKSEKTTSTLMRIEKGRKLAPLDAGGMENKFGLTRRKNIMGILPLGENSQTEPMSEMPSIIIWVVHSIGLLW